MPNIMFEIEEVLFQISEMIDDLPNVSAAKIGLDPRAGRVFVDVDEGVIITQNAGSLDYYGGFEYVEDDSKLVFGDYTIYHSEMQDSRVANAVEYYQHNHAEDIAA